MTTKPFVQSRQVRTGLTMSAFILLLGGCGTLERLNSVEGKVVGERTKLLDDTYKDDDTSGNNYSWKWSECTSVNGDRKKSLESIELFNPMSVPLGSIAAAATQFIPIVADGLKNGFDRQREEVLSEYKAEHHASVSPKSFKCLADEKTFTYKREIDDPDDGNEQVDAFVYRGEIETASLPGSSDAFSNNKIKVARVVADQIAFHHPKARHASDKGVDVAVKMKFSFFAKSRKEATGFIKLTSPSITLFSGNMKQDFQCSNVGGGNNNVGKCKVQSDWFILPHDSPGTITIAVAETGKGQDAAKKAGEVLDSLIDKSIDYGVKKVKENKEDPGNGEEDPDNSEQDTGAP